MASKPISQLPTITSLNISDLFVLNHGGTTSTATLDTLTKAVSSATNFIPRPAATNGQVLTYNGSTWVASAPPAAGAITSTANIGGGIKIFDTPGPNQSWTCPPGVYSVKITVIGGGGGIQEGGGSSSCSVGGVTITATGGDAAGGWSTGNGGSVAPVDGYVGAGTGGGGVWGGNGTGSNGGYGGGGATWVVPGGCSQNHSSSGGCGIGGGGGGFMGIYGASGGTGSGYGGARGSNGYGAGGGGNRGLGGGGGYAVYTVATIPGTYTNAIVVGNGGSNGDLRASRGAVIIEW